MAGLTTDSALAEVLLRGREDFNRRFRRARHHNRWLSANVVGAESRDFAAGALLADDMGLGKTFVSLAGIREFCPASHPL